MNRKVLAFAMVLGMGALATPASAQIIATSIPTESAAPPSPGSGGAPTPRAERSRAFHLMASPFAKWDLNVAQIESDSALVAHANPNSTFLIAAEAAFRVTDTIQLGAGGWYNKVGRTDYDFGFADDRGNAIGGTLESDLNIWELHGNVFWKSFGLQVGVLRNSGSLESFVVGGQRITTASLGLESDFSSTDTDAFLVFKGGVSRASYSVGLGGYAYGGEDGSTVPSGFLTASVPVFKGFTVDGSFWYIGKSDDIKGLGNRDVSDSASRLTVGVGYTFSR